MQQTFSYCPKCTQALTFPEQGYIHCPDKACGFVLYENPTPVVAAIVEDPAHEEVILVQSHGWPSHWFGLVTGFLEKHEDPAEAVLREVEEEIGLQGKLISFIGHYPFKRMNQLIIAYHVQCLGDVSLGDELAAFKRVAIEQVQPWASGTGYALRDWLETRGRADIELIPLRP